MYETPRLTEDVSRLWFFGKYRPSPKIFGEHWSRSRFNHVEKNNFKDAPCSANFEGGPGVRCGRAVAASAVAARPDTCFFANWSIMPLWGLFLVWLPLRSLPAPARSARIQVLKKIYFTSQIYSNSNLACCLLKLLQAFICYCYFVI